MCLSIDCNIKPSKVNKDGFCIGWKVIWHDNRSFYLPGYHEYIIGLNVSSRRAKELTKDEINTRELTIRGSIVIKGFHLFTTRDSARIFKDCRNVVKLIKVYYKPEDVIAYGYFGILKSVAVTELTIKSLQNIR